MVGEPWQWADDGLYLRQAEAFIRWLHGDIAQWLGPYDAVLLSKAPLFGVWMAVLHLLHFPLRPAEFASILLLPWLFRSAVRPIYDLRGWRWALTAILLVGLPFLPQEQRLLRSALQAALAGGCLISAVGLILRARFSGAERQRWASLTGLYFALSYLNREEAIWLTPAVVCALGAVMAGAWAQRAWRPAVAAVSCLLGTFIVPVAAVSLLNSQSYGLLRTTVRRAPAFTRAHQVMTSLVPETRERYVPIRAATRLKAYELSPTFARLRSYLEGPSSDSIARNPGHLSLNGRPADAREFFVSNFEFALREAAFQAGAQSPTKAEAMFAEIERELLAAVAAGQVSAGNRGPAIMTAPLPGDYSRIFRQAWVSLSKLYSLNSMIFPGQRTSSGDPRDLQRMANMTHTALAPTAAMRSTQPPEIAAGSRRALYRVVTVLDGVAYGVGTITVLALALVTLVSPRRDHVRLEQVVAGLMLCLSVMTFSVAMAVVDVLGFPLLQWGVAYNSLGYIPLSVLGAFGVVVALASVERHWTSETENKISTIGCLGSAAFLAPGA